MLEKPSEKASERSAEKAPEKPAERSSEKATDKPAERSPEKAPEKPAEKPAAPELSVERVTHQDIPAICTLYKRVWESEAGLPAELVKAWQPTPLEFPSWMEGVTYFAARRGGHLVGVVGCEFRRGTCRLVQLAVEPDRRRQAVGTALVNAAVDWARRSNAAAVWADPLARFQAAGLLLRKLGFAESGLLHRHEWGEDVRFFERVL
ncbi:MAG TPA: GNAT family N-acetyltransferase [Thermoplasmata archaeon]|nr:GNAT family N-acetyltransferase [Thermoplasmata archaeon]